MSEQENVGSKESVVMKVLVIDDEDISRTISAAIVEKAGFTAIPFSDGNTAYEYIKTCKEPFAMVLDWMMPVIDGITLCKLVRDTVSEYHPFIIMLTQNTSMDEHILALESGADDYLAKPVEPRILDIKLKVAFRSIQEQRFTLELQAKLSRDATTDELTSIYNRRYGLIQIQKQLNKLLRQSKDYGSLILIDIDHFKRFNDSYGHSCGDNVLVEFTKNILNFIRPYDVFCRYGGEEFLLYCELNIIDVEMYIERLRHRIESTEFSFDDQPMQITASFGAVCFSGREIMNKKLEELIMIADEAMYQAKAQGRNRAVMADLKHQYNTASDN